MEHLLARRNRDRAFTFFYKDNSTPTPAAGKDPKCKKLGKKLGRQKRRVRKLHGTAKQSYIEKSIADTKRRMKKLDC